LLADETILVISSNNPLRAYVKELEGIPVDQVADIALGTAELRVYDFDAGGAITGKTVHQVGEGH
jgi:bisphosphoglycerate-dependent phosphoglycerate mutase